MGALCSACSQPCTIDKEPPLSENQFEQHSSITETQRIPPLNSCDMEAPTQTACDDPHLQSINVDKACLPSSLTSQAPADIVSESIEKANIARCNESFREGRLGGEETGRPIKRQDEHWADWTVAATYAAVPGQHQVIQSAGIAVAPGFQEFGSLWTQSPESTSQPWSPRFDGGMDNTESEKDFSGLAPDAPAKWPRFASIERWISTIVDEHDEIKIRESRTKVSRSIGTQTCTDGDQSPRASLGMLANAVGNSSPQMREKQPFVWQKMPSVGTWLVTTVQEHMSLKPLGNRLLVDEASYADELGKMQLGSEELGSLLSRTGAYTGSTLLQPDVAWPGETLKGTSPINHRKVMAFDVWVDAQLIMSKAQGPEASKQTQIAKSRHGDALEALWSDVPFVGSSPATPTVESPMSTDSSMSNEPLSEISLPLVLGSETHIKKAFCPLLCKEALEATTGCDVDDKNITRLLSEVCLLDLPPSELQLAAASPLGNLGMSSLEDSNLQWLLGAEATARSVSPWHLLPSVGTWLVQEHTVDEVQEASILHWRDGVTEVASGNVSITPCNPVMMQAPADTLLSFDPYAPSQTEGATGDEGECPIT